MAPMITAFSLFFSSVRSTPGSFLGLYRLLQYIDLQLHFLKLRLERFNFVWRCGLALRKLPAWIVGKIHKSYRSLLNVFLPPYIDTGSTVTGLFWYQLYISPSSKQRRKISSFFARWGCRRWSGVLLYFVRDAFVFCNFFLAPIHVYNPCFEGYPSYWITFDTDWTSLYNSSERSLWSSEYPMLFLLLKQYQSPRFCPHPRTIFYLTFISRSYIRRVYQATKS